MFIVEIVLDQDGDALRALASCYGRASIYHVSVRVPPSFVTKRIEKDSPNGALDPSTVRLPKKTRDAIETFRKHLSSPPLEFYLTTWRGNLQPDDVVVVLPGNVSMGDADWDTVMLYAGGEDFRDGTFSPRTRINGGGLLSSWLVVFLMLFEWFRGGCVLSFDHSALPFVVCAVRPTAHSAPAQYERWLLCSKRLKTPSSREDFGRNRPLPTAVVRDGDGATAWNTFSRRAISGAPIGIATVMSLFLFVLMFATGPLLYFAYGSRWIGGAAYLATSVATGRAVWTYFACTWISLNQTKREGTVNLPLLIMLHPLLAAAFAVTFAMRVLHALLTGVDLRATNVAPLRTNIRDDVVPKFLLECREDLNFR